MYGVSLEHNLDTLPKMPKDEDSWSVMHSWALPTRSFLEYVMFSRYLSSSRYLYLLSNGLWCLNLLIHVPNVILSLESTFKVCTYCITSNLVYCNATVCGTDNSIKESYLYQILDGCLLVLYIFYDMLHIFIRNVSTPKMLKILKHE